jgi:hypothetical protein
MYTVNGIHPGQGLNNIFVLEGDEIVWHYVDDSYQEAMDYFSGSTGNTATWNTWFDVADGPAINAGAIVTLEDAEIVKNETTFTATLPAGSKYPTADQIKITPEDANATVSDLQTADDGKTWTFKVTAEIGTTIEYELDVVIEEAPVVPNITLINGGSATPIADVTANVENGTATLHVEADKPCVVILKKADGSYERLEATKNGNGYNFSQEGYDDSMEFIVAVKGDYDGNGKFNTNDLAKANKDIVAKKTIDPLMILIMDASGDALRPNALGKLRLAMVNKTMTW